MRRICAAHRVVGEVLTPPSYPTKVGLLMLPGETTSPEACPDCRTTLETKVCRSFAGYYLGTECPCGPYARESDYFYTKSAAEAELVMWTTFDVRPNARTPGFLEAA